MPPLWQLDQDLFKAIHVGWRQSWLSGVMTVVSMSGLGYIQAAALLLVAFRKQLHRALFFGLVIVVPALLYLIEHKASASGSWFVLVALFGLVEKRAALFMAESILVSGILSRIFVYFLPRDRPSNLPFSIPLEDIHGSTSFPSGHTTTSFAIAAVAVYLLGKEKPLLASVIALWAAMVGLSRIYVGVHYPLDTVAGALIGVGSGCIVGWWAQSKRQDKTSPIERNLS